MEEELTMLDNELIEKKNKIVETITGLLEMVSNEKNEFLVAKNNKIKYMNEILDRGIKSLEEQYTREKSLIKEKYEKKLVKRACMVGINYEDSPYELYGCVNDVIKLKEILKSKYGYNESNIKTIVNKQGTRENIIDAFVELLKSGEEGDQLFFSFSGHGLYMTDDNKEELDGNDELIVSVDYYAIFDDELKYIIDTYLKPNVKLFALFDNCNSGTVLDLPYQYYKSSTMNGSISMNSSETPIHHYKNKDTISSVICLSGCRDDQESMDAYLQGEYNGAMTWALVNVLSENDTENMSWMECISKIRSKLKENSFMQIPQLTSGQQIDMTSTYVDV
jgi:hypothetical protein